MLTRYKKKEIPYAHMWYKMNELKHNKILTRNKKIKIPFERSFASTPYAHMWSTMNELKSNEMFKYSNKYYMFECNICNHLFDAALHKITNGQNCPYCDGHRLCGDYDCEMCTERSFASCPQSIYWSSC